MSFAKIMKQTLYRREIGLIISPSCGVMFCLWKSRQSLYQPELVWHFPSRFPVHGILSFLLAKSSPASSTTVHSSIVLWAFKQTVKDGHGLLLVNHLWNEYMDNMYVHSWGSFIWILKRSKGTAWSIFLVGMINIFHLRAHFKKYHLFLLNTTSLLFKNYNFSPFG